MHLVENLSFQKFQNKSNCTGKEISALLLFSNIFGENIMHGEKLDGTMG